MNTRIKQLAEQAWDNLVDEMGDVVSEDGSLNSDFLHTYVQRFAELIVRECAYVADENYIHRGSRTCGLAIIQHFGVEEPKGYQPTGWVCPKCGTDRTKAACPRGRGAATDGSCPMFGVAQ